MKVYKAVRKFGNAYVSACMDAVGFMLVYDIGNTTTAPEKTKLFVFRTAEAARSFAMSCQDGRVLECETNELEDGVITRIPRLTDDPDDIQMFWDERDSTDEEDWWFDMIFVPDSTLTCNSVRVVREVR